MWCDTLPTTRDSLTDTLHAMLRVVRDGAIGPGAAPGLARDRMGLVLQEIRDHIKIPANVRFAVGMHTAFLGRLRGASGERERPAIPSTEGKVTFFLRADGSVGAVRLALPSPAAAIDTALLRAVEAFGAERSVPTLPDEITGDSLQLQLKDDRVGVTRR